MFNIGPMEFVMLGIVGIIVLGPDRLPDLARDAARMIRTLRDLAQGARTQLRDELGPEFADLDLASLHPRNALRNVLGDDLDDLDLRKDLRKLNPKAYLQDAIMGADERPDTAPAQGGVSLAKPTARPAEPPAGGGEPARFDPDAT